MSRENVEVVYRAYDAVRRRDKEAFVREMHPDVGGRLYTMQAEGNFLQWSRGHAAVHR